jgi:hypothetical protein
MGTPTGGSRTLGQPQHLQGIELINDFLTGSSLEVGIRCAAGDPSHNEAHSETARNFQGIDLMTYLRTTGRKMSTFGWLAGAREMRRPCCLTSSARPWRSYIFVAPSQRFSSPVSFLITHYCHSINIIKCFLH